jgi:peptide/nickel transport system substrate-binding protein
VLATGSFAIVPSDSYPADELETKDFIGSGRYEVADYEPGQQTVLQANPNYSGDAPPKTDQAIIQYFDKASALKLALEQGDVDIAYRSLSPTDLSDLGNADGVQVVSGQGAEIRYMVFNLDLMPGDNDEQKLAIRKAIAQTIDRQSIADNVYDGTVKPLYSMIPTGLQYSGPSFDEAYGEAPDTDAATQTLQDAGVKTPVPLEIWYTPSHYGASSGDEYAEIKRQLDDSGLFDVTLKSTEWNQYSEAAFTDKYPIYQLGWFPDYPDADDYVGNFYSNTSFMNIHYDNPEMQKLLAEEKASTDEDTRQQAFDQIQKIGAEDIPQIPIWEADQVGAQRDDVQGLEETFDPAFIFRFWLLSKGS